MHQSDAGHERLDAAIIGKHRRNLAQSGQTPVGRIGLGEVRDHSNPVSVEREIVTPADRIERALDEASDAEDRSADRLAGST